MADFFKNTIGKVTDYFKNLEKGQKTRFFVFTFLAVAIVIAASVLLNQKSYTVLYSGMEAQDAGEVLSLLEEMDVDAKPQGADTILVESSKADSVRMQLASEGYPKSGLNFDIFSNASGLGTTDMEKRVYYQFQLQENLGQVIKKMEKIDDAVVSLSLAQESAYVLSKDEKPASASVLLKLKEGAALESSEARTIAELVSKSVSGLSLDDVRIVDSNMKLYSLDEQEEPIKTAQQTYETIGTQLALQKNVQDSIQKQVINLLTPVFGEGRVFAEVGVTLNFDKQKSESVEFAPPIEGGTEGLAVSMQELAESIKGDAAATGVTGMDSSGGTSITTTYPELETDADSIYSKVSRETNLELNETRTQIDNAQGQVLDLSVGVVINSTDMEDDYSENVQNLVANAIGVELDKVSVEMMPFFQLGTDNEPDIEEAFNSQKEMMSQAVSAATMRTLIIAGTVVLIFLIALAAIAALRKKPAPVMYAVNEDPGAIVDLQAGDEDILPPAEEEPAVEIPEISEIENTTLASLEKYIDKSPDAVVQLLRNWLSDDTK